MTNTNQNKVETIGNAIALILGLAFLGDLFELWSFSAFDGWWVLFLYIPAICGFITKGVTAGGIMLLLTAGVLTAGMFTDLDGRIWGAALLVYLAFLGARSLRRSWSASAQENGENEEEAE